MIDWPNHTAPQREWDEASHGARMHHGWILAGKMGLGKREFALAAARQLVSEGGVTHGEGDHPDIHVLTYLPKDDKEAKKREQGKPYEVKRNIGVAQIREMQRRLTTRPTLGSRRVIIVDPADDMERNASNALLKSLEEPPEGTFFLLVTHRPARLLPTIRSRCRILRFPELNDEDLSARLANLLPEMDGKQRAAAIASAGGSLGAAQRYLEQDLGEIADIMRQMVRNGDPTFDLRRMLNKAIGARPDRSKIQSMIEIARSIASDEAKESAGERRLAMIEAHSALVELAGQAPTYNFDPGLLISETGGLLARAAEASERANV